MFLGIYINVLFAICRLGGVSLKQLRTADLLTDPPAMIETPTFANKTGYLFSLYYTSVSNRIYIFFCIKIVFNTLFQVNKSSPEFTTKHKSVEQRIDIDFTVFILRLHQERLVELLSLVNEFQLKYDSVVAKQAAATNTEGKDRVGDAGAAVGSTAVHAIGAVLATIAEEGAQPDLPVKGESVILCKWLCIYNQYFYSFCSEITTTSSRKCEAASNGKDR